MGVTVVCNEQIVWSPSLTVGNVFFQQIKKMEEILNKESGVSMYLADEIDIDQNTFESFIRNSMAYLEKTQNTPLVAMLSGCIEVSLYLFYLINKRWLETPPALQFLLERAQSMNKPPFT